ncbi:hypothetical protein GH714_029019 [Hevea brasiliensis]|uniref:Uncharacterized protein n=1 Tax=Hevea brasiliensis TaxID=3981 RepID=A0A6A6KLC9_HEVBR|nr:hypothetical protein GH714_029019 [Hevea brasiliensis]
MALRSLDDVKESDEEEIMNVGADAVVQVEDIEIVEDGSFESKQGCDIEKYFIVLKPRAELVKPIIASLNSGQIRESNRAMLHADAIQEQCKVIDLGIAEDDKDLDRVMDKDLFVGIINKSAFEFVKHICERMVSLDSFNQDEGAMLKATNIGFSVLNDEGRKKLINDEKLKCKMKPTFSGDSIGYLSRIKCKLK